MKESAVITIASGDTVIKTEHGYISVNYPNDQTPRYMYTPDMAMAKRYTKRGAAVVIAKLGFGQPEPYVRPELTQEDIEWMDEFITKY